MTWRVRRATTADSAALSLVASATFLETYAGTLDGQDLVSHCITHNQPDKFAAWAKGPDSAIALGELAPGNAPVGYAVLTSPDLPVVLQPDDIELRRIYTLGRMHGTGLGPALMAWAIDEAAHSSKKRLLLGVYARNERARAFYEKQGFTPVGARQFRVGDTLHDDLVYARAIQS